MYKTNCDLSYAKLTLFPIISQGGLFTPPMVVVKNVSGQDVPHPDDPDLKFLTILPIDLTRTKKQLLGREVWWQENVGVHKFGLNKRNDLATVSRRRKK